MGTIEARELYCFTTGTQPFAGAIHNAKGLKQIKNIVADAAGTYQEWYGSKGTQIFTATDIDDAVVTIYEEGKQ